MRRALTLARRGWGLTAPNPLVGAVVVRDGRVVGEGWHARYGAPHAEAAALVAAGDRARGADVYVSLEPCAHHGKTPPCADALIAAGVRRVVIAVSDPNPVAGGGAERLRKAGIEVVVGVGQAAAEALNAPFLFSHRRADRPYVTLKLALSEEGAIAAAGRTQRWLTGDRARRLVHRQRAQADAVLVGIGTVLTDNPQLTVRSGRRPRVAPRRLVLDRRCRLPLESELVRTSAMVPVEVLAEQPDPQRQRALEAAGVQVSLAPTLGAHLTALRAREVRHLYAEGGVAVAEALLGGGFVDRLIIFRAPVSLGAGAHRGLGLALPPPEGSEGWDVVERRRLGDDRMTVYRPATR